MSWAEFTWCRGSRSLRFQIAHLPAGTSIGVTCRTSVGSPFVGAGSCQQKGCRQKGWRQLPAKVLALWICRWNNLWKCGSWSLSPLRSSLATFPSSSLIYFPLPAYWQLPPAFRLAALLLATTCANKWLPTERRISQAYVISIFLMKGRQKTNLPGQT